MVRARLRFLVACTLVLPLARPASALGPARPDDPDEPAVAASGDPAPGGTPQSDPTPSPGGTAESGASPRRDTTRAANETRPGPRDGAAPRSTATTPALDQIAPPPPDDSWLDSSHDFVEQRIFAPVLRFDRFFSDERELEPERARSFLRWRSDIRYEEHRGFVYGTSVSANLRLPGLNSWLKRMRVVIAGEAADALGAIFPDDDAEDVDGVAVGSGDAGLRYDLWQGIASHVDVGGGVLLDLPPGVFGRLRFRYALPIGELLLARFATSGFWRTDTRLGTHAELFFERPILPSVVTRIGGQGTLTQRSAGVEWRTEAAVVLGLGPRSAASLAGDVTGRTDGPVEIDRYRVFTRLRRDFYRRWIFVEVEPEMAWPWDPVEGRRPTAALTLRLEVQFHGNEAPPARAAPALPEPPDPPPPSPPAAG